MMSSRAVNNIDSQSEAVAGQRAGLAESFRQWEGAVRERRALLASLGRSVTATLALALVPLGLLHVSLGWDGFPSVAAWSAGAALAAFSLLAASLPLLPASWASGRERQSVGFANHLTTARLVLVAPTVLLICEGHPIAGLVYYALGAATDVADGIHARRHNESSRFGTVMDPIADIAATTGVFAAFLLRGWVPGWVFAILIIRYVTFFFGVAALIAVVGPIRLKATLAGKVAGVLQASGTMGILVLEAGGVAWQPTVGPWLYPFFGTIFGGVFVSQLVIGIRHVRQGPVHE